MPLNNNARVVLIAMDHSDLCRLAFRWYVENVRRQDDKVIIVNVQRVDDLMVNPMYYLLPFGVDSLPFHAVPEFQESYEQTNLETFTNLLNHYKINGTVKSIDTTHKGKGIVRMANKMAADLVVMRFHGRSLIKRKLFGSVSEYVMKKSKIPVLVYKRKLDKRV